MSLNDLNVIWEQVLIKLAERLDQPPFESWIKPLQFIEMDESHFTVSTTSTLSKEWIFKNYAVVITQAFREITGKSFDLKITVEKDRVPNSRLQDNTEVSMEPEPAKYQNKSISLTEFQINALRSTSNNLNLKYTFETFVVGANNKFCHAAALAVARFPGKSHNPLFIYGGVGLGKTHIMQAIGHHILANHPDTKIKYTSTEMFTTELVNSLRHDKMTDFKQRYRKIDVLLLDDIQFIEGKTSTQEEVFHTFNTLYESGKQLIIASDRHPKNIPTLTERLRSRFEWGLLADIQVPDLETRVAILKNKAEKDNMSVPDDVLGLVATAYPNNIRELEGALNRVVAYVSINDCPMTVDTVRSIINFQGSTNNLSIDKIIQATAGYFSLESADIKGQNRAKEISQARQIAVYLTRDMTGSSFPSIGDSFGGRKHTTILYAYEKIKEEMLINKHLAEMISEISKRVTSGNF